MENIKRIFLGIDGKQEDFYDLRRKHGRGGTLLGVLGIKTCADTEAWGYNSVATERPRDFKWFADLKMYGTPPDIARRVAGIAALGSLYAPHYLSVAADIGEEGVKAAVAAAGPINIVVVPLLSTMTHDQCLEHYGHLAEVIYTKHAMMGFQAGAQGLTCPAWLLPSLQEELTHKTKPFIIATGIRSDGLPPGDHYLPRSPEWAIENGADAVVLESEILGAKEPLRALNEVVERIKAVERVPA